VKLAPALVAVIAVASGGWRSEPPLPVARTEVAAAVSGEEIVVAGGYLADGPTTAMRRLTVWPYRDEATPSTALTIPS
jgi:hypothetical protein